VHVAIETSLL